MAKQGDPQCLARKLVGGGALSGGVRRVSSLSGGLFLVSEFAKASPIGAGFRMCREMRKRYGWFPMLGNIAK